MELPSTTVADQLSPSATNDVGLYGLFLFKISAATTTTTTNTRAKMVNCFFFMAITPSQLLIC